MTVEREDCFHKHYYVYIRRLLTITGLWPYLKISRRLPSVTFITILMILAINGQIYIIVTAALENKVEVIPEVMQTLLPTFLFTTGYWNLLYNSTLIKEILERISNDWSKLTCEDELNIMVTYAAQTRVASELVACAFLFYILFLMVPSIINFIFYVSGIIDITKIILPVYHENFVASKYHYYMAFFFEVPGILVTYIIGVTHYLLFIMLLQHACTLFIIGVNKIGQPFEKEECKFNWTQTVAKHEDEYRWIVAVIQKYNDAIDFVELIRLLYGKMYIIELIFIFGFVIIDFIYFFQLLGFTLTLREGLKIFLYINGTMLMIYAYFYLGERLIEHSTNVYVKCLLVPLYTLSHRTKKLLLLFILRSQKPCNLSVSGTAIASHEFFAKIIKTSFTFATFFYNVR